MPRQHIVQQGECLSGIAAKYDFRDYKLIYNHQANRAFRQKRPNPNIIFPGDAIVIPDKKVKEDPAQTDNVHIFRVPLRKRVLRLRLLDADGQPIANEPVTLKVDDEETYDRTTDGQGKLEVPVEIASQRAEMTVRGVAMLLNVAHLNPIYDTDDKGVTGIKARLQNLGYYDGPLNETVDTATRVAVSLFQKDMGIEVDAELTRQTVDRLIEEHGC